MGKITFCYDDERSALQALSVIKHIIERYGIGLYPVQIAYIENGDVLTPYEDMFLNRKGIDAIFEEHVKGNL